MIMEIKKRNKRLTMEGIKWKWRKREDKGEAEVKEKEREKKRGKTISKQIQSKIENIKQ